MLLGSMYENTFPMVPKSFSNSKATSFYATLKFLVFKKSWDFSKNVARGKGQVLETKLRKLVLKIIFFNSYF